MEELILQEVQRRGSFEMRVALLNLRFSVIIILLYAFAEIGEQYIKNGELYHICKLYLKKPD